MYRRRMETALLDAIQRHDVAAVRSWLRWGANPNAKLSLVVDNSLPDKGDDRANEDAIACLLIRQGADLHPEHKGFPYLHAACSTGSMEVVRCLLERGADPCESNINGETPLNVAVNFCLNPPNGKGQSAQRQTMTRQIIAMLRRKGGQYTLWDAAKMGDIDALKAALDAGIPADAFAPRQFYHKTALLCAVDYGRLDAVKLLIARGANRSLTSEGASLLSAAIGKGDREMVRLLLAHGANVNHKSKLSYEVPLIAAIQHMPEIVPTLLARGADVNVSEGGSVSPLWVAVGRRRLGIVLMLLRRGAHVAAPARPLPIHNHQSHNMPQITAAIASGAASPSSRNGLVVGSSSENRVGPPLPSVLEEAVAHFPECLDILLKAGGNASPDRRDLLLTAAQYGQTELFPRLLAIGSDVNAVGGMGETPLMLAITRAPAGVKALLKYGANANAVDEFQHTPLFIAVTAGNTEAVNLLLAHGANVNARPPRSHTALYYARKKKNATVIALLEKAGAIEDR